MSNVDFPRSSRWRVARLDLGMSEADMQSLLDKSAAERTEELARRFYEIEDADAKVALLTILGEVGDLEMTAELYIDTLKLGTDRLKFWAALEGGMPWFEGHERLREAIAKHLRGASCAMEAWLRDAFPDGSSCGVSDRSKPPRPEKS